MPSSSSQSRFTNLIPNTDNYFNTRLITRRSKPDYVCFVVVVVNVVVVVLIVLTVYKGLVVKVYLILIKAITVVELASRPCLELAFTLPNPLLDLAMNLL